MRSVLIVGVSTLAIALAACSSSRNNNGTANAAPQSAQPSYSTAQTQPQQPQAAPTASQEASQVKLSSNEVKQAQRKLKQEGDYRGAIDGKVGPKTEQAVRDYQQKSGLQQTGYLDTETMSKLGLEQGSGSSMPPANHKTY